MVDVVEDVDVDIVVDVVPVDIVVDVVEDVDVARADIALVDVAARAEVAFPAIFAFPAKLQEMQLANIVPAARAA